MARATIPFTDNERVISANVRALREQRRLSQTDLAAAMGGGWTANTVSKIETINGANNRHLSADELVRLARVLQVSLSEIATENIAGSPEFVAAVRAGEEYIDAVVAAVQAANKAVMKSGDFSSARDEIPKGEVESMHPNSRSYFEELLTYSTPKMLLALSRVPEAYKDASHEE